jgi:choline dehydrogenase-like flavoprotein
MIINGNEISSPTTYKADVCVMGGGVAGITLANELSARGRSVVLLEAGGKRLNKKVQSDGAAEYVSPTYPSPTQNRVRTLGGSSTHWANNTSPLSEIDFEKRDGLINSGWPIAKKDIEPYYNKAAMYCRVGDDNYDPQYWHAKYGINSTFDGRESDILELGIAKASVPPTQFYHVNGQGLDSSNIVQVVTFAHVDSVDFNSDLKRIERVRFVSGSGVNCHVEASEFVMAFGGLENARMLLHFNKKNKNELGNQGDSVGRYFMDHPSFNAAQLYSNDPSKFTLFDGKLSEDYRLFTLNFFEFTRKALEDNGITNMRMPMSVATRQQMSHGISSLHILKDSLTGGEIDGSVASHITNVLMDFDIVADTISRKVFGQKITEESQEKAGFIMPVMVEQSPHRDNRITLGTSKDRFGVPLMRVNWKLHETDRERMWRCLELFGTEIGALGMGRVRVLRERASRFFNDQIGFGHHHMGTTRMSDSPENGVVNGEHLVFGTENFSMAGCSVFSTGGHVPPTLTITAMSIRLADIIHNRM